MFTNNTWDEPHVVATDSSKVASHQNGEHCVMLSIRMDSPSFLFPVSSHTLVSTLFLLFFFKSKNTFFVYKKKTPNHVHLFLFYRAISPRFFL